MYFGAITDIGMCRKINEDSYCVHNEDTFPYAVVADGMGGHQAGEIASRMAIDIIEDGLNKMLNEALDYVEAGEAVRQAFMSANSVIYDYAKNNYKVMGMGTTATFAMVYQDKIITANVGDSRTYKADKTGIVQLTRDHSYVQELVLRGEISPEMAKHHPKKNFITRAMGAEDTVKVDITIKPYNGETLILCSDGLTNFVDDEEILSHIRQKKSLQESVEALTALANSRGGRDNITIVAFGKGEINDEK